MDPLDTPASSLWPDAGPEDDQARDIPARLVTNLENGRQVVHLALADDERPEEIIARDLRYKLGPDPFAFGVPSTAIAGPGPLRRKGGTITREDNPDLPSRQHGHVGAVLRVITCRTTDDGVTVVQIDTDPAAEIDPPNIRVYVNDGCVYDVDRDLTP